MAPTHFCEIRVGFTPLDDRSKEGVSVPRVLLDPQRLSPGNRGEEGEAVAVISYMLCKASSQHF